MGRKKIYASNAERMAAYRARKTESQAAEIEALRAQVASAAVHPPLIEIDALQDEIRDLTQRLQAADRAKQALEFELRDALRTKPGKLPKQAAGKHRQAALSASFVGSFHASPDEAKRFRANTTRAATAAAEVARLLENADFQLRQYLDGDIQLLKIAVGILSSYASSFEGAQRDAEHTRQKRERERMEQHNHRVALLAKQLFGDPINVNAVQVMAADLLEFIGHGEAWLVGKKSALGVTGALISLGSSSNEDFRIREAMTTHSGEPNKLALVVAEILGSTKKAGRTFEYHGDLLWSAGLDDFDAWRVERGHGKV